MTVPSPSLAIPLEVSARRPADTSMLECARRGEADAVAWLYDEHHHAVRRFAVRLLGDTDTAEDLVHDVFLSLPGAMRRWRGQGSIRSLLFGIAVNKARRHLRSLRRRRAATDRFSQQPRAANEESPEATMRRAELVQSLQCALDDLPLKQRVAFVLCELEERTSVEAAAIVGVSAGTMRSRLHHAKAKLRARLEREGFR